MNRQRHSPWTFVLAAIAFLLILAPAHVAQSPAATISIFGHGYPVPPLRPELTSTLPVLGSPVTLSATSCWGGAPLYLAASAGDPSPTQVAPGGLVYLDPAAFLIIGPFTVAADGAWSLGGVLSADPGLAGTTWTLQAVVIDAPTPTGFQLTNALMWSVGY